MSLKIPDLNGFHVKLYILYHTELYFILVSFTEEQQLKKIAALLEQVKNMKEFIDSEHIKGMLT